MSKRPLPKKTTETKNRRRQSSPNPHLEVHLLQLFGLSFALGWQYIWASEFEASVSLYNWVTNFVLSLFFFFNKTKLPISPS